MILKVQRLREDAILPRRILPQDAGLDLYSVEEVTLDPGAWHRIRTGIAIELEPGTEGQIRSRSGLASEYGVVVLNSPGTIDAGYRGEVGVILMNHGHASFTVCRGMRVAQLVVATLTTVEVQEVAQLTGSERGMSGFGSTEVAPG